MPDTYVSPTGSGDKSGSSPANAAPISALDSMVQKAGAGGTVNLLADKGAYNLTGSITLKHGGADGAPVTIHGVNSDGSPANITVNGSRDPNWGTSHGADGNTIFKLYAGASNLDFEHINFNNVGMAFNIAADLKNITFGKMHADNVRYFAGNYPGGGSSMANVTGLTLHDIDVHGFSKSVLILKGDAHGIRVNNVLGDGEYQDGDAFEMGISLQGTVHDVVISNSTMKNCIAVGATGDYTNGDGFVTERGNYDISYINCTATGNGDGGFDLKSSNTTLTDCYSEDNKRNYRIWGDNVTLNNDIGLDPHKRVAGVSGTQCNLWVSSEATNVVVNGGSFIDSGSATHAISNEGGSLTLNGVTIVHAVGGTLLDGGSHTHGLDTSLVTSVSPTGSFSIDGHILIPPVSGGTSSDGGSAAPGPVAGTGSDAGAGSTPTGSDSGGGSTTTSGSVDGTVGQTPSPVTTATPGQAWAGTSASDTYHAADTSNWSLVGHAGNDLLYGNAGNDTLDGGAGIDRMFGGAGDDTYMVRDATDYAYEQAGAGTDTVIASVSAALRANIENLTLTGTSDLSARGNELANVLSGNDAANHLFGLAGDDTLVGGGGRDILDGGTGSDTLRGGSDNDIYVVDSSSDVIVENAGEGVDFVRSSASFTLSANVERMYLVGSANNDGTGNDLANLLVGNSGDNALSGMGANDRLYGGGGADVLNGGDGNDYLEGGAGQDIFIGGSGEDHFVFRDGDFGGATAGTADRIEDFAFGDRISLSPVDADTNLDGNQGFAFIGTSAFDGTAGELRYEQVDGNTCLSGDTNGDGLADFMIKLDGLHTLTSNDLLL